MTRFETGGLCPKSDSDARRLRWVCVGFLVPIVGGFAILTFDLITRHGPLTLIPADGLVGFIAVLLGLFVLNTGPGAVYVEVGEESVGFGYPNGRVQHWVWSSPKFKLVVDQTSGSNDNLSRGIPMQSATADRGFQNFLTPSALDAILETSRRKAIPISETPSPRPGWTRITIGRR